MKAAILEQIDRPLVIAEVEPANPLLIGQVLVKILVSGLCGAQLQEIRGDKGNAKYVPHLLGHEGCGEVVEIGPGVSKIQVGDRVILHWRKGDGIEAPFPEYIYKGKKITSGKITTLSEYSIVSENRLTKVSPTTSPDLCALLGCALSTALGIIDNDAQIKLGERVAVLGCGGVGLSIIQGAILAGAVSVLGIDSSYAKQTLVENHGGKFLNSNCDTIATEVDCIIDTTGSMELVSRWIPLLSNTGRIIIVSQPKANSNLTITQPGLFFRGEGIRISTTQGGKVNPSTDLQRYIRLYEKMRIHLAKTITHRFRLDDINLAVDVLRRGEAGRILIDLT